MRRLIVIVLAICALLGAAVAKKPAGKAGAKKREAPQATQAPKAPKDALLAAADEITRQVAALRGLPTKKPLERGVLSRDEIGAKLKERIGKEYTPEEVHAEARVLKRLELLPRDADYETLILDLLMEQVAGFYDPFAGRLYIADWLPLEMQRPALAHEIQHALQDQHFDLKRFAQPLKEDGDRQLGRAALVEGDGTAVMLEFQAQAMGLPLDQLPVLVAQIGKQMIEGGMGSTPKFDKAPAFLKETLIFPYLAGLKFVEHFRNGQPWAKIDDIFKNPPESTEQVLHPEKYVAQEHPVKITPAPIASLGGRKEIRRDVLGELELKILFASKGTEEQAEKAAAGWGGDRLVAYADPAQPDALPVVVDYTVWDSETDAKEAEAAGRRLMERLTGKPAQAVGPSGVFDDGGLEEYLVERKGDKVLFVFGAPAQTAARVAADVWKSWKVAR